MHNMTENLISHLPSFFCPAAFSCFFPSVSSKLRDSPFIQIYLQVIFRSHFHPSSPHTRRELTREEKLCWGRTHHRRGTREEEQNVSICLLSKCLGTLVISHPHTTNSRCKRNLLTEQHKIQSSLQTGSTHSLRHGSQNS